MSTRSQLTKDLNESVKSLLGKHVKILLKNVVKLETKGDKTENRVLVFSPCRLFLLTAKVPTRIDFHFHYLEIQAIESKKPNQLSLTVGDKVYSFLTGDETGSQEVDAMVLALATAIRNIFPTVPLQHIIRKVEVLPSKRIQQLQEGELGRGHDGRGLGPCGGFSTQYACMCDYHGMPYREEVSWDVDTIYLSHDTRELCLRDFDHLDAKDIVPIISALEYNTWFTKLRASNIKLTHEALDRILHVMKKSLSIEELYLDNLGVKWDFAHKLSLALIANNSTPLHTLDLSNNMIEDKGATSLCGIIAKIIQGASHLSSPLAKVPKGLIHLNLSHCGLSSKGVNQVAHALSLNKFMPSTLTYLNLSDNNLKEEINNLCNFLAQPNSLTHLDISGTDTALETIFGALLRGCATNLVHLNVSRNVFSAKKTKEVPPSFKQFFTSTLSLKHLNMSFCKLPLEALKNLLLGLACNESTIEIELDMSCNNLGAQGAHVLESCIHGIRCIGSLDISENNMDVDLASVVTAVSKNKSIKHLNMGRNLNNMKPKHISSVMDAVVQMIQDEDCVLQSLSIPDSKLKSDLYNLINALGSNQCLQSIDISGNLMGDAGARLLAKALQINSRLKSIIYDRNNITLQGYCDLAYALESNYTVRYMPFPIYDVVPCMKTSSERTDSVMRKIQDLLHRNVSPKKYSNGQAFRLQQGFLLSSTQQMVDRLVVQTQDTIRTLSQESTDNNNDINYATGLIQDADNSKQLLPRLQEVVQRREEASNPIDVKLKQVADELHSVAVGYLQGTLESMMKCAEDQCPHVLADDRVQGEIRKMCHEKIFLPPEFIHTCLVEQAGADIMNKVNELNLAVVAHVSDRITDEVIESLSQSYKTLMGDVNKKRSSTPDVLRSRSRMSSDSSRNDPSESFSMADTLSQQSDQSPMATPHLSTKRKSLHGRKLRPKSVVDSVDGLSADDIPDLLPSLPKSTEESLDSVAELPTAVGQQLQHLVKGRPRRAKTRAPSRPMLRPAEIIENIQDLGEGLDTFFRPGSVTPTGTPLVSPTSDDSSHTFPSEGSPNHQSGSKDDWKNADSKSSLGGEGKTVRISPDPPQTCGASNKCGTDEDKCNSGNNLKEKTGRSSPLLKGVSGLLEPAAPRSRSSDNLEKYSPLIGRRSQGDSPLTASPLARRMPGQEGSLEGGQLTREDSSGSITQEFGCSGDKTDGSARVPKIKVGVNNTVLAEMKARQEKRTSSPRQDSDPDKEKPPSPTVLPSVRLRSTGLADSLRSPTNGFPKGSSGEVPKSPILKSVTKEICGSRTNSDSGSCCSSGKQCPSKVKPPPPIAPKPRPWSMVGGDRKSGEFSLPSDGSSTNTSAANTPDSGDALDESTDSGVASMGSGSGPGGGEKRSVREMAASLSKHGGPDSDSKKKGASHSESDVADSKAFQQHSSGPVNSAISLSAVRGTRKLSHVEELQESLADRPAPQNEKLATARVRQQSFVLETEFTHDDVVDV
ncbi:F-actin-uncapping protein LRRC16A isoform X2 [Zootermopsis nevadensis]|uniref:Leucine-rich repeat-containing protein 16A n=1 Tax=Zootermopsis nevadensis TaxID=136037 RepID=A0A067QY91_ZOONE|nr:F-actin-uncapping protein LRRC16A isoform X2 [Zootermopsis nevadensis]KDR15295.1 Leucine-rich repeat-containing protein 16A [Zootermopsis nevadensis]